MLNKWVFLVVSLGFLSVTGHGAPIVDQDLGTYKAGWVSSEGQTCKVACKKAGMVAEYEEISIPFIDAKHTALCKARLSVPGQKGTAFGNNFLGEKYSEYCIVSLADGQYVPALDFSCLCVARP